MQFDNLLILCIGFIGLLSKGKSLLGYTNLFSPDD